MLKNQLFALSLILVFCCSSCSNEQSPENIVKSFAESVEEAAESGNGRKLRSLISENYHDEKQRTAHDISAIASSYLFRNRSIHILKKMTEIKPLPDHSISATILAAISATPVSDIYALPGVNADIYWFDVIIVEDGGSWKLVSSSWRQALVSDFLPD